MISVFSSTNRPDNKTVPFAESYYHSLVKFGKEEVNFIDFRDLSSELLHTLMYDQTSQSKQIIEMQDKYLIPAEKFVFFIPEYNGSFPGILKLFIDACSIRRYKDSFAGKKAALIGISEGRSGNIRGLEHFSSILNHMGTIIYPNLLPVSQIVKLLDQDNKQIDKDTLHLLEKHAKAFLDF